MWVIPVTEGVKGVIWCLFSGGRHSSDFYATPSFYRLRGAYHEVAICLPIYAVASGSEIYNTRVCDRTTSSYTRPWQIKCSGKRRHNMTPNLLIQTLKHVRISAFVVLKDKGTDSQLPSSPCRDASILQHLILFQKRLCSPQIIKLILSHVHLSFVKEL